MCRNSKGYEIAEHLSAKFTHISPVWLQLRWDAAAAAFTVTGQHDIDTDWMARVAQPTVKARSCLSNPEKGCCGLQAQLSMQPLASCDLHASLHQPMLNTLCV